MASAATDGIRQSSLSPRFLHSNSTSHTWPFSAVAELIDNAYDPDVNAKQIWIDKTVLNSETCLTFTDNGKGMTLDKLYKMLSFGFSDKVAVNGHMPVGLYGNGFKSGSMRLGKDAIVFTKNGSEMHVGMLSQTYLEKINAEHVIVPIISFDEQKQLVKTLDCVANLNAILTHSIVKTEREVLVELDAIIGKTGTRIIIWNLRSEKNGDTEFDFETDKYDIRIPEDNDGSSKKGYKKQERKDQVPPDSDYSLRAYCSILYMKPRMKIIIRGEKVQTQLVSKSLALIEKDVYRPRFLGNKPVKITFGYNCRNKEHYGILMYNKNRLIKAYEKVGCQSRANNEGVGVVGIIECNFLTPTHNKQDFDFTYEYRRTLSNLADKLYDYWHAMKEKRHALSSDDIPVEDVQKKPDQTWAQCDDCLKWRKLPDDIGKLPEKWYCHMNPDPQFRDCNVPQEPEDDDEITQPTYEKTNKKRKSEAAQQVSSKSSILVPLLSKEMQAAFPHVRGHYRSAPLPGPSAAAPKTAGQPSPQANRQKRSGAPEHSMTAAKKPYVTVPETTGPPGGDATADSDGIIKENSTSIPNDNSRPPNCIIPELITGVMAEANHTHSGVTDIKRESDSNAYANFHSTRQVPDNNDYGCFNGTTTQDEFFHYLNVQSPVQAVDYKKDEYCEHCDELIGMVKHLENQLALTSSHQTSKETSETYIQTDPVPEPPQDKSEVEQLKQQKLQMDSEIQRLKIEVEQLKKTQNAALDSTLRDESTKLLTLRGNVAQLLTMLMPDLNLQQTDEVEVIDDILQQVLEQTEKEDHGHQ
ncbi:MORC family CW-type zinc finger protein 3-like [Pyxicephalus adspersus]|uniref:MORC family CW-type zinc finger protein 3-like n=1 Tax=Pyxicephalus adspersus TaxID=30357 RepID=UPI003B5B1958